MNLTELAIRNRWLTYTLVVFALFSGLFVFNSMPRDDMPPFLIRAVTVVSRFPGASPARVEQLVTDKIEKVIQEVPEVDYITSESRPGISVITVMIKENEFDLRPIFDTIRRKVEDMQNELPQGVIPHIDDELGDVFGVLIGITGEGFSPAELKDVADDVRDDLIKLPQVAKVEIAGELPEQIYITYDDARLARLGLSKSKIESLIQSTNIIFPGGDVLVGKDRIILEPSGNFESIENLKDLIISEQGSADQIRLKDVAVVHRGYKDPPDNHVRVSGVPGLVLGCSLKKGGNIVKMGNAVNERIRMYERIYPHGIEFIRVASQDSKVKKSIEDFLGNLMQSVVVVLITMLVFLGLRTGMVVASLIPTTIVVTILVMSLLGVGLNQVSLASLIIALGMLVDNAIVMSESMMVRMEKGASNLDAALGAAGELAVPLMVSSLTTAAAFLSFFLAESVMGEIMGQLFEVVTAALMSSWVLSLTIIPMLAMILIRVAPTEEEKKGPVAVMRGIYRGGLVASLRNPKLFAVMTVVIFAAAMKLFSYIPFIFFPDSDREVVSANLELPIGVDISETDRITKEIEGYIQDQLMAEGEKEGVVSFSSYVAEGAPKYDLGYTAPESAPYTAHILLNTTSDPANDIVIEGLYRFCFDNYPDLKAQVSRLKSGGGSTDPIAIRISGDDGDRLFAFSETVKEKLRSIPGTRNVADDWGIRSKKFMVRIDQNRARLAGMTSQDVATSLQTMLSGATTGTYREGDKSIPIVMIRETPEQIDLATLESLNIYAQSSGQNVPVKQVADIEVVFEPAKVLRRDLTRTITVVSEIAPGMTAAAIMKEMRPWLREKASGLGPGYNYELGGEAEDSGKAISAVVKKLPLSAFVIVILLIAQFNSLKKPLIVLMTIPLGIIGVSIGLFGCRSYFGFMPFLGVISLAGIVINNAIVLLDRIRIEMEENGLPPALAIVAAALQRFRPILLTTATTGLGLIPLWIGGGVMWRPMAITIFFGLLFGTVITLLFVPVSYVLLFGVKTEELQ